MKTQDFPYEACKTCKTLGDCPCPEVIEDGMGSPLPPESCPRPLEIMRDTTKMKKLHKINPS